MVVVNGNNSLLAPADGVSELLTLAHGASDLYFIWQESDTCSSLDWLKIKDVRFILQCHSARHEFVASTIGFAVNITECC